MKKSYFSVHWLILLLLAATVQLSAQPLKITFGMKGKTGTPDSVYVINLNKGTKLLLNGGDELLLTTPTIAMEYMTGNIDLVIFPNPVHDQSTIRFYNAQDGLGTLQLFDITGRQIAVQKNKLPQGTIQYVVSGIPPGTYLLHVNTPMRSFSKTVISTGNYTVNPCLRLLGTEYGAVMNKSGNGQMKSAGNIAGSKVMEYSKGEKLTFKAYLTGAETKTDTLVPGSDLQLEFGIFYYILTDYDLKTYLAVAIGKQVWMAEDLKVKHYPNGNLISEAKEDGVWMHDKDKAAVAAYCYYGNDKKSDSTLLYSWPAALGNKGVYSSANPSGVQGICPEGWHLPSMEEWIDLRKFITQDGNTSREGKALKSTSGWANSGNGTDNYGFCALPGGQRGYMGFDSGAVTYYGSFIAKGDNAVYWTSTSMAVDAAAAARLMQNSNKIELISDMRSHGFSIRCVRDKPAGN